MIILTIILACILSAILYRCGGMDKEDTTKPKWIPKLMRKSFVRDWGCSLVFMVLCWILYGYNYDQWLGYLLYWGLSAIALNAYWGLDSKKWGFWAHGLGCSIAGIPLIGCGVPWQIVTLRILICTIGMGLWSKFESNDVREELGRGLLFIL